TNGIGTFLVTLKTASGSPWTVTAKAAADPNIFGTSGNITVSAGAASYFTVTGPRGTVTTGTSFGVTVAAHDSFGNIATAYTGHVHFTSSDSGATLPADATLSGGVASFSAAFGTAGSQVITVT